MKTRLRYNAEHHQNAENYGLLLMALTLLLLMPIPMMIFPNYANILVEIGFSLVIIIGVYVSTTTVHHFRYGILMGIFPLVFTWLGYADSKSIPLHLLRYLSYITFYIYLAYHLFRDLIRRTNITFNIIYGSICGFIIIGIIGGSFAQILELLVPNSFSNIGDYGNFELYYFSYITLTSVGYGDVVPLNPAAESLSIVLAITGQVYLTIVVAILVGKYLTEGEKKEEQ